ncbi:MAG: 1-acyl-sn-glycerol-3-phosphate acyltransferase [Bermanella sp.]
MIRLIRFILLCIVKLVCSVLYRFKIRWLSDENFKQFKDVRLIVFLNHTSLFEPLFIGACPVSVLWRLSGELIAPGADITLNDRPIVGRIYHSLLPGLVPITRKKDESWQHFMSLVSKDTLVAILPEGRMKRSTGLDKHGNAMTVRGGVADILQVKQHGKVLFVYSGGLHHIHTPGDKFPSVFKTITANAQMMDIQTYKDSLPLAVDHDFREQVVMDMQKRLDTHTPF